MKPDQDGQDRRLLVTKPLEKLHGEGVDQGDVAQALENTLRRLQRPTAQTQQTVR